MTDEFIIKELRDQKEYWQKEIERLRQKVMEAEDQLAKVERLLYVMGNAAKSKEG